MAHQLLEIPTIAEEDVELPAYSSPDASGADVRAFIKEDIILSPGEIALIPTGLTFAIPHGYELQVRPRSGMALKYGVTVLNTPGTIDADYRGELGVILINHGKETFIIKNGMRIAQIVLAPVLQANFNPQKQIAQTQRGAGGFGHTGAH